MFFFSLDEEIVRGAVFLLTCLRVRDSISGSKRAAQCRIVAITNEQRGENKTYMKEKLSKGVILSLAAGDLYCKQFQLSAFL